MRSGTQDIPKGWRLIEFGKCAKFINGRAYKKSEERERGTPVLRIQNLNGGDRWFYSDLSLPADKYCYPGDLLYAWSATFGPYRFNGPKCIFHYHIWRVIPTHELDKNYAYFLLKKITNELKMTARGISMLHLTKSGIEAWPILLPPLSEQKRIAEILDRAEALRSQRRAALTLLDELTQSIFLDMFGDPVTNPKRFPMGKMGDLFSVKHGFAFKSEYFCDKAAHILLTPGNFFEEGGYRDRGDKQKFYSGPIQEDYVLDRGDLLVAMTEQAPGLLGSPLFVPESGLFLHNQRLGLLQLKECVDKQYVFGLLNTTGVRLAIRASSTGTKVKHTSPSKLAAIDVPIPPLSLQETYSQRIKSIEQLRESSSISYSVLSILFASLQHRAFRGEL